MHLHYDSNARYLVIIVVCRLTGILLSLSRKEGATFEQWSSERTTEAGNGKNYVRLRMLFIMFGY